MNQINQINQNLDNLLIKLNSFNKTYYQIILIVIANDTNDYYCEMIKKYWIPFINYIKQHKLSIKVFLLFGQKIKNIQIDSDDIIIANTGEGWRPYILKKTIFAFEHIYKNYNFKHLIRTNLSSFFISNKLLELSHNLKEKNIYTGRDGNRFASGAAFWLSKDILLYVIENKNKLNYNISDDVAIGHLLFNKFYTNIITSRQDISERNNYNNLLNKIDLNILKSYDSYHIRIKSINRYNDAKIMKILFDYNYK
jgi:hypothetical protein